MIARNLALSERVNSRESLYWGPLKRAAGSITSYYVKHELLHLCLRKQLMDFASRNKIHDKGKCQVEIRHFFTIIL